MAKLSKTMQAVMDSFEEAEHYYKVVGLDWRKTITFHNGKGRIPVGFTRTWIYFDGMYGITENTKTLEALEKRGLIKIHEVGGDCADVIEVIGKTPHKPLEKATKIKVTRWYPDRPSWGPTELIEYMDANTTTIEEIEKRYRESHKAAEYKVEQLEEVELTRWDYRIKKEV